MFVLLRRTSFLTTFYGLYFSHHCTHIIFHMLDLCGKLSCTASTPVFLTYQYSSCFLGFHSEPLPLQIATLTLLSPSTSGSGCCPQMIFYLLHAVPSWKATLVTTFVTFNARCPACCLVWTSRQFLLDKMNSRLGDWKTAESWPMLKFRLRVTESQSDRVTEWQTHKGSLRSQGEK